MAFLETLEAINEMDAWAEEHVPGQGGHQILIERSGNGDAIIDVLQRKYLPGRIEPLNASGGKLSRANAASASIAAGHVLLPGSPNDDYIGFNPHLTPHETKGFVAELTAFPNGTNDDQVDAMSYALNYLATRSGRNAWILR
jgi:predicted phage terminase large subunit-like protein